MVRAMHGGGACATSRRSAPARKARHRPRWLNDRPTTSGISPSLDNVGIGIGYLAGVSEGDEIMQASPRKAVRAVVVRPPFV